MSDDSLYFLRHRPALRSIRLRGLCWYHDNDDDEEFLQSAILWSHDIKPYEITVWARPAPEGWTGWYRQEHVGHQPEITWLKGMWAEVKLTPTGELVESSGACSSGAASESS